MRREGALIVYDIQNRVSRRLLVGDNSVQAKDFLTTINSTQLVREMVLFRVFTVRPNVDSIALSRDGSQLYFASVNDPQLYQVATKDLRDATLSPEQLAHRVTVFCNKTQSDGMTTDSAGNIYYGDMEKSAIVRINTQLSEPTYETLFQSDLLLRWPDGFSFGPDGYLYVTCSALQYVLGCSDWTIQAKSPYFLFRFKPGFSAPAGQ